MSFFANSTLLTLTEIPSQQPRLRSPAPRPLVHDGAPPHKLQSASSDHPGPAPRVSSLDTLSLYCTCNSPCFHKVQINQHSHKTIKQTRPYRLAISTAMIRSRSYLGYGEPLIGFWPYFLHENSSGGISAIFELIAGTLTTFFIRFFLKKLKPKKKIIRAVIRCWYW